MKKILTLLLALTLCFAFVSCGGGDDTGTDQDAQTPVERDLAEGDYSDMGEGTMYLSTAGGTSEDGNVPVLYVEADTMLQQIGLDSEGMDGSILSYIYVDGMEVAKEQLADTQTVIDLGEAQLTEGVHTVEVVQYADDDTAGEMVTYKSAQYEVKPE